MTWSLDPAIVDRCSRIVGSAAFIDAELQRKRIEHSSHVLLSVAPTLACVSFLVCSTCSVLLLVAVARGRLDSTKYSVVASRTLADVFSSLLIAAASLVANVNSASFAVLALFLYVATFGFVQLALSHLLVVVFHQVTLSRPHAPSTVFSRPRVLIALVIVWILSILYCAAFSPLTNVILNPHLSIQACSYKSCQKPLLVIALSLIAFLIAATVVFYFAVLHRLRKIAASEKLHNEPQVTRERLLSYLAFGGHIALFVLISSLVLTGTAIILHNVWLYDKVRHVDANCRVVEYMNTLMRLETIAGGAVLLWLVRCIFDVVFLFLSNYRRLLPWLAENPNTRRLHDSHAVVSRSDSLRWQRGCFNCPVFTLEKAICAWEVKN